MCLTINTDMHGSGKKFSPKVAKIPILVWKALNNDRKRVTGAYSPYLGFFWRFGETQHAKLSIDNGEFVNDGLHAHVLSKEQRTNSEMVRRYTDYYHSLWSIDNRTLYPAVIPAGTKFVIGAAADVVSEALTVYRNTEEMLAAIGVKKIGKGIKYDTLKSW